MYKMLLRDIVSGKMQWFESCYLNGKVEKNKVILWQSPEDDEIKRYKIVAWKWQGFDKRISKKDKAINDFATEVLLDLDIPQEWRDELKAWQNA